MTMDPAAPAEPSERPILMAAPMVRALLAGTKTQTRRALKQELVRSEWRSVLTLCPYGEPGDVLWVRETFLGWFNASDRSFSSVAAYKADGYELRSGERWVPSIHMPRLASRIDLRVTGVRVERLQEISEADARAEGCDGYRPDDDPFRDVEPQQEYRELWGSLHGHGSWDANPWVWVIEFERIRP